MLRNRLALVAAMLAAGCTVPQAPLVVAEPPDCDPCERPVVSVSEYALSPCDSRKAWLPEKGPIDETTWWRAKRRDEQTIDRCAARHDRLVEEVKALLGEIRSHE